MPNKTHEKIPKQIHEFAIPVHRSIIKRDLWLGIPFIPLIILLFISIVIVLGAEQWTFLFASLIIWFILRRITKDDEWLLDISISSLIQSEEYR